jgi:hypothetical protein
MSFFKSLFAFCFLIIIFFAKKGKSIIYILYSMIISIIFNLFKVKSDSTSQVTDLQASNQTLTSVYLTWQNPITNYDSLILKYYIQEENAIFLVNFTSYTSNYTISSLQPGSSLNISLITVKNGLEIDTSNQIIAYTSNDCSNCKIFIFYFNFIIIIALDVITNLKIIKQTSNSILANYTDPKGFFDFLVFACISLLDEASTDKNFNLAGSQEMQCLNLQPGNNYSIVIGTIKLFSNQSLNGYSISNSTISNTCK